MARLSVPVSRILHTVASTFLAVAIFFAPSATTAEAAGCKITDPTLRLAIIERNITSLERMAKGSEGTRLAASLRAKVASLRSSGSGFRSKAAPIEEECQAVTEKMKQLKVAREKRDAALKPLYAERKAMIEKYKALNEELKSIRAKRDTALKPLNASGKTLSTQYKAWRQGYDAHIASRPSQCDQTDWKKTGCSSVASSWNAANTRYKSESNAFKSKFAALNTKIKAIRADYAKAYKAWQTRRKAVGDYKSLNQKIKDIQTAYANQAKPVEAQRKALGERYKAYNGEVKTWTSQMGALWSESATAIQQAMTRARQGTPNRSGGDVGKLSGKFAPGASGRDPGSRALPPGKTATDKGAKGQARATLKSTKEGMKDGDAGAAFGAGRVFDRGDVKVGGASGGDAVDARGIAPRTYSRAVRESSGFQQLLSREKAHRETKAKAEQKVKEIEQKLQSGSGNKGQLQVDLVRARDQVNSAQNQINQVTVEKESFAVNFTEKSAPAPTVPPPGTK